MFIISADEKKKPDEEYILIIFKLKGLGPLKI